MTTEKSTILSCPAQLDHELKSKAKESHYSAEFCNWDRKVCKLLATLRLNLGKNLRGKVPLLTALE